MEKKIADIEYYADIITNSILQAIVSSAPESAIAFSGGLDSSFLAYLSRRRYSLYVCGLAESYDVRAARKSARMLGSDLHEIIVDEDEIIETALTVKKIDPVINLSDLGYETVLALMLERIDEKNLITGQGSDEIFYGYNRFKEKPDLDNTESIRKLFEVTLPREIKIASHFGKKLILPYLQDPIIEIGNLPRSAHIVDGTNKFILRQTAIISGMSRSISMASKKAAQYGSGISRVLGRNRGRLGIKC